MKIIHAKSYEDLSCEAANIISAQITQKSNSVFGFATGSTPIGTYEQLVQRYKKGELDFSGITAVNLDEYVGLSEDHEQSYRYFMNTRLYDHINIDKSHTFVPIGTAQDIDNECLRYEELINSLGGIDLQLLGIGHNGHIGFNEPNTCFSTTTHCVKLKDTTIKANSRFFASEAQVPTHAITMGIKTIMQAKKILLIASGAEKADIMQKTLYGPVMPSVPASILQMHPDLTVVAFDCI